MEFWPPKHGTSLVDWIHAAAAIGAPNPADKAIGHIALAQRAQERHRRVETFMDALWSFFSASIQA